MIENQTPVVVVVSGKKQDEKGQGDRDEDEEGDEDSS